MGSEVQTSIKSVPAASRRSLDLLGWSITLLDEPADTGGAFMLFEGRTASGGIVPPHHEENHESFYILEGSFELELDGEVHRAEVGDFASIQPGVLHSVRNVGPGWGRVMFAVSGGQHQRFFEAIGEPLAVGADPTALTAPPDFERIDTAGRASGIHFVPPPAA